MSVDKRSPNLINSTLLPNPGPYLARIVNNADPMKQGSLEVELLRPIGNQKESSQQLFVVRYLSPFYGVTPLDVTGTDPAEFNDTQKSYGFWAVPPDVGVTVMVIFVDSDPGQGYWMGCVQDALMNHMIPGIAGSTSYQDKVRGNSDIEWEQVEDTKSRYGEEAKLLPVGEVNRRLFKEGKSTPNPDVEANKKPIHPIAERLLTQGTISDPHRGVYTSSARRESPSNVYGWSTPGPVDKRKGARKGKIGRLESKINKFVSRMGGHCIVMDDGDDRFLRKTRPWEGPPEYADLEKGEEGLVDFPKDEAFRIRTRKGAQILMHSSEDFIYICNSRGTAWIELTSNGKIEMYAREGIHQTSGGDVQVTANRNISHHANGDHMAFAGSNHVVVANADISHKASGSAFLHSENDASIMAANYLYTEGQSGHNLKSENINFSGNSYEWNIGHSLNMNVKGNLHIKANNTFISSDFSTHLSSGEDTRITGRDIHTISGGDTTMNTYGSMHVASNNSLIMTADAGASLKGKALFLQGTDGTVLKAGGTGLAVASGGNIVMNSGAEIHMQGGESAPPDAPNTPYWAKDAAPSQEGSGAVGMQTAGGGYSNLIDFVHFNTDGFGKSYNKRTLNAEPSFHENQNPAGLSVRLTNYHDPRTLVPPSGKQYTIKTNFQSDETFTRVPKGANFDAPNMGTSNTARPLDKDYSAQYARHWAKDKDFLGKVESLAGKYGCSKEEVLAVFGVETDYTMSPSKCSPGSARVGLIQMSEADAREAGTSIASLKKMSRAEQVYWVDKFLSSKGNISNVAQLYLAVIGMSTGTSDDKEVYKRGSPMWCLLPKWRAGPNGKITPKSIKSAFKKEAERVKKMLGEGNSSTGKGPSYPSGSNSSGSGSSPSTGNPRTTSAPNYPTGGGTNPTTRA